MDPEQGLRIKYRQKYCQIYDPMVMEEDILDPNIGDKRDIYWWFDWFWRSEELVFTGKYQVNPNLRRSASMDQTSPASSWQRDCSGIMSLDATPPPKGTELLVARDFNMNLAET